MNGRDKFLLAGAAVLLAGLATTAALSNDDVEEQPEIAEVDPYALVRTDVTKEDAMIGANRLLRKATPSGEIPEEFKEAENYLKKRWGHMGDAGLVAPGVMPEGDQYFVDKKVVSGVRGNGKPIYAKTYIRAHRYVGPLMNRGATLGREERPAELEPARAKEAQIPDNLKRLIKKQGPGANKIRNVKNPKLSGGGYLPRSQAIGTGNN